MDIKWSPRGKGKEPVVPSSGPVASSKESAPSLREPAISNNDAVLPAREPAAAAKNIVSPGRPSVTLASSSYRDSAKQAIADEVRAIIEEEIRNAAKELAEEHKMVIWAAFAENKRIIREVLDQELVAIRERIEATRQSIVRDGIR